MMFDVFFGCAAALILDRVVFSAIQVWGMQRVGRHVARNLDRKFEAAKKRATDRRAN